MTKRRYTLGQDFNKDNQAERLDGHQYLLSLIEGGRHGELVAYLSRLRLQSSHAVDPLLQNLLESAYHLCMAWVHSLDRGHLSDRNRAGDRERQGILEDQLRALCLSLHDLAAEPKRVGQPKISGWLPASMLSMLNYFSKGKWAATEASTAALPASSTRKAEVEGHGHGPSYDRGDEHEIALEEQSGRLQSASTMSVYFFGSFRVCINGEFISDWRNAKGKIIFKYLVAHKRCSIAKECLMETFWPNNDPECARNNLNVAIYNIRQALKRNGKKLHAIVYSDGQYGLSPEFKIWTDFEEFDRLFDRARTYESEGDLGQQMFTLNALDELYGGDFLEEDRFEAWVLPLRQKFQDMYKVAVDKRAELHFSRHQYDRSIDMYKKVNAIDPCDEQAHRRLMTCYVRLGQNHLAMRQFNSCVEALARELDLAPDAATVDLLERIRRREPV